MRVDPDKEAFVDHEHLVEADFSGRRLRRFTAVVSTFERCCFDHARVDYGAFGAGQGQSRYEECSFDGARIRFAPGGNTRFVRCSFQDVRLEEWLGPAHELVECTFSGRLKRSGFVGAIPKDEWAHTGRKRNEFRGNDFSNVELDDVGFIGGIDLSKQRLPSGPQYLYLPNAEETVQSVRVEVTHWQDADLRRHALQVIEFLEEVLGGGQRQLFLRQDTFAAQPREVVERVFAELRSASRQ